jgi:hypothetical protein
MIIEGIFGAVIGFVISYVYFMIKDRREYNRLVKEYDESKNKSGGRYEEGYGSASKTESPATGLGELEGGQLLPTANTNPDGKTSSGNGKASPLADFFAKFSQKN